MGGKRSFASHGLMSDVDEEEVVVEEEEEEEITDLISAIKKVLKNAMISDCVVRGLHGVAKALDAKKAQVCFLAENSRSPRTRSSCRRSARSTPCRSSRCPTTKSSASGLDSARSTKMATRARWLAPRASASRTTVRRAP